jgi:hypothetical protein
MKRLLPVMLLAGCVAPAEAPAGRSVVVDGVEMNVRAVADTALYSYVVNADGSEGTGIVGRGDAVLVGGAPDRDMAIWAYGRFCNIMADPAEWGGDFVPQVPGTGEYQFGACP